MSTSWKQSTTDHLLLQPSRGQEHDDATANDPIEHGDEPVTPAATAARSGIGFLSSPGKLAIAGLVMIGMSPVPILMAFPGLAMSSGSYAHSDEFFTTAYLPFVGLLGFGTYLIVAATIWQMVRHFRT